MRVDLANMLRQVGDALLSTEDKEPAYLDVYAAGIAKLNGHVLQVRDGRLTLEAFADLYMLTPRVGSRNERGGGTTTHHSDAPADTREASAPASRSARDVFDPSRPASPAPQDEDGAQEARR